jgi:hypothetical protein
MKKIDKIFDDLHYELITEKQAKQQVLDLFSVINSVCLHEPQYQSYNSETKLQICDKCKAITN